MFLSIITRHLPERKRLLQLNVDSLLTQDDQDYEHIILPDPYHRGVEWANEMLATRDWSDIHGDYVMLLDDDNMLNVPDFISQLKRYPEADIILWQVDIPTLGLIPENCNFGTVQKCHIDGNGVAVRRDVWLQGVKYYHFDYAADFDYINACYAMSSKKVWIQSPLTRAIVRSLGK